MYRKREKTVLDEVAEAFIDVVEDHCKYVIVARYVAIAHGRSRGTEDIDVILEALDRDAFLGVHQDLEEAGFQCMQSDDGGTVYDDYLDEGTAARYVRQDAMLPEVEVKLARDRLDEYQLDNRERPSFAQSQPYFPPVEVSIAFKEELLGSDKDVEDAKHLRIIYEDERGEDRRSETVDTEGEVVRDPSHNDQVERWARFVKNNPREVWIAELKPFIDGQIEKANRFYDRIAGERGSDTVERLRQIHR